MTRIATVFGAALVAAGLAGCAQTQDVSAFPDLRLPDAPAPEPLTAGERDAAIADLQKAAADNAALAE